MVPKNSKTKKRNLIDNSFKSHFRNYLASFREIYSLKALTVASFDILFYLLFFGLTYSLSYVVNIVSKPIKGLDPSLIMAAQGADLGNEQAVVARVIASLFIMLVIYALILILCFTLSRYMIWTTLMNKAMKAYALLKFFLLNLILVIALSLIITLSILPMGKISDLTALTIYSILIYVPLSLLTAYFTYILYYTFVSQELVFSSFKKSFFACIRYARYLWLPVALIMITLIIIVIISMLSNFMPAIIANIFLGLLLMALLTWIKIYAVSSMKKAITE
jgi:hypothetical protein